MNNDEVEKNIIEAIEILGKVVTENFKFINKRLDGMGEGNKLYLDAISDRISNIVNLLTLKENEEKTATNEAGNTTVGPGIIKKKERPKPETPIEEGSYYVDAIFDRETEKAEMYSHPDDPRLITWVPKSVIKTYDNKLCKLTLINKYALDKYIKWEERTS